MENQANQVNTNRLADLTLIIIGLMFLIGIGFVVKGACNLYQYESNRPVVVENLKETTIALAKQREKDAAEAALKTEAPCKTKQECELRSADLEAKEELRMRGIIVTEVRK